MVIGRTHEDRGGDGCGQDAGGNVRVTLHPGTIAGNTTDGIVAGYDECGRLGGGGRVPASERGTGWHHRG